MTRQAGSLQGWILTASCWMSVIGAILIAPVLPFMQKDFEQYSNAAILVTIVLVCPSVVIAICSPFIGIVVNAIGRKRTLMGAIILYAIAGTAPIWLTNIYAIIGSRMLVGIAETALTGVASVLTADYFSGRSRERWLALQFGSAAVVAVVGFAIGGALGAQALGWRTPFVVYGAMIILLPLFAIFLWEPSSNQSEDAKAASSFTSFPWRLIGPICLMTMLGATAFYVIPVQISFLLNDRGVDTPEKIGLASALANIGVPVGSFLFQVLARQPIMRLLTGSMILFAVGFWLIAAYPDVQWIIVGSFIVCTGAGILMPLLLTWTMSQLPFESRGLGSGGFNGSFFVGQFLSPVMIGVLATITGGLFPAIGIMSYIFTGAAAISLAFSLTHSGATISLAGKDVPQGLSH